MSGAPSLGDRLRARRVGLGLTLAAVAERAGLSLQYVSNLERGRGNPTLEALTVLAEALEVTLSDLLTEGEQAAGDELVLAQAPPSLVQFARSARFRSAVERLAGEHSCTEQEMRRRLLIGMTSAPRRSTGDPTEDDWRRLLDVYALILADR